MIELFSYMVQGDFESLRQLSSINVLLFLLMVILLVESAFVFLPLPGDSLVIFTGSLVGFGLLDFHVALIALTFCAGTGSVVAYLQGRYLKRTRLMEHARKAVPSNAMQRACDLLQRYGFLSLFASRFIPFVRVITPMLMGTSSFRLLRTMAISYGSALVWVGSLLVMGKLAMLNHRLEEYQEILIQSLMLLSLSLMVLALGGIIYRMFIRRQKAISD